MTPYTPQSVFQEHEDRLAEKKAEIKQLQAENKRLRAALEWYANEKNWEMEGPGEHWTVRAYQDTGEIASIALKGGAQ